MSLLRGMIIPAAALLLFFGCGGGGPTDTDSTDQAPAAVSDLAVSGVDDSLVTLTWSAPHDPSKRLTVDEYDLRYSTSAITSATWENAYTLNGEPSPDDAGGSEIFSVTGLIPGTVYHFAMKSADDKAQWSGLSNVVTAETDSIDNRLIAYYPLVGDSIDITGFNDPMSLMNTPFQEGGIYGNGVYIGDLGPNGCHAITPDLESLDLDSFTLQARFKVGGYAEVPYNPVMVGGDLYRWIGFYLQPDSTVALMYNDGAVVPSAVEYAPNTWYTGTITYDGTAAKLYLDGNLACEATVGLNHGNERRVGITNTSTGHVFEGIIGRLKIYNGVVTPGS